MKFSKLSVFKHARALARVQAYLYIHECVDVYRIVVNKSQPSEVYYHYSTKERNF